MKDHELTYFATHIMQAIVMCATLLYVVWTYRQVNIDNLVTMMDVEMGSCLEQLSVCEIERACE